jgi:hypothetical protein
MNQIANPGYTFTEAALAAGVPPKTLRGWLDRTKNYNLALDADEEREGIGWRRFSLLDVLRFAMARRLVQCCVPVTKSFEMVSEYLTQRLGLLVTYKNTPVQAITAYVQKDEIWFWPGDEQWHFAVYVGLDHPAFGSGGTPGELLSIIRVSLVVSAVFERLELGGDDD